MKRYGSRHVEGGGTVHAETKTYKELTVYPMMPSLQSTDKALSKGWYCPVCKRTGSRRMFVNVTLYDDASTAVAARNRKTNIPFKTRNRSDQITKSFMMDSSSSLSVRGVEVFLSKAEIIQFLRSTR